MVTGNNLARIVAGESLAEQKEVTSLSFSLFVLQAKFLTQDQINEFKECFSLYDKRQKGRIKASDLKVVMRSLGTSPTLGEVARHLQLHKIDVNEELDFSTFLTMMYRQMQQEDPRNEILLAMLMVDQQRTGFISVAELQAKLMNLGEKLSKEEGESQAKVFVP
uniref:Calglandulin n=1 Tax=Laticauda laticaudata TaxID=8630 RepID=A0A8C5SKV0_LATLA